MAVRGSVGVLGLGAIGGICARHLLKAFGDVMVYDLDAARVATAVETGATRIANNVTLLVQAIVLNYMALHNEVGMFDMVLPGHSLGAAADLDQLIAFAPIR